MEHEKLQKLILRIVRQSSTEKQPVRSRIIRVALLSHGILIADVPLRKILKEPFLLLEKNVYGCRHGFYIAKTMEGFKRGIAWQERKYKKIAHNTGQMRKKMKRMFPKQLEIKL